MTDIETIARERMFPLQTSSTVPVGPLSIPWSVAGKAYSAYVLRHGRSQSMERIAERGGFGWCEMDRLYPAWRAEVDEVVRLRSELALTKRKLEDALAGVGAPARALTDIQIHLANTGPCDSPSCLLWGHLAAMLRRAGYAQGPIFDEHFEGTSLERRP